ncbi:MAG TPA: SDR family oxidoreductase [Terriglobales bacterium]|nr:SDR family oxidoreductase [Terriglobales bacterium]
MDLQLTDKTALITGSTAGIGFAIASLFAQEGAAVVVNGRTQKRVDDAVARIRSKQKAARVTGIAADLGTRQGVDQLTKSLSNIDILVNNLSIFEVKPFFEIPDEDWFRFFEVNVLSGVRLSRFYLPGMLKRNWGRIVFISSESALQIPVEMIHYGFTKTAQLSLARGLAEMTAGSNVTVNCVLPGPTRSEGVETFLQDLAKSQGKNMATLEKEFFHSARPSSLLQRFASSEEVAPMVVYVCSPLASATNGAALRVDGGVVRSIA